MKKTVVFDFEGVIHSYTSGWKGEDVIPDPPVIGIKDSIQQIRNAGYEVVVVSTRCATSKGLEAVKTYLSDYEITVDRVCKEKPPAIVYVDDRAICFDGKSEELFDKIESFEPWYKKKTTMINEIRADMLKVKKMVSEVEMIIGKREGNSQLVNQLIDAENLLTYCMSRLENAFLSRNADSAFQDGLNEARDLYKAEVPTENKRCSEQARILKKDERKYYIDYSLFAEWDYPDKESAFKAAKEWVFDYLKQLGTEINLNTTADVVEVKHGEWVKPYINRYGHPCHCCSICGFKASQQDKNFCPDCGAKMDGERKEGAE